MRGSHPGSFDVAHALRDGQVFEFDGIEPADEVDLVVVGAGISGLATAWFYRQREPKASILLLDNHDDFGGHAKRNELWVGDRLLIGYGGSEAMQSPAGLYSDVARGLIAALGVDLGRFHTAFDRNLYPGLELSRGVFFSREAFGRDALVTGDPMRMVADDIPIDRMNERSPAAFIADFPVSDAAKSALVDLFTSARNPLEGVSQDEAVALLATTSYRDYVQRYWGLNDEAADTFQGRSHDFFAMGIDRVSAYDAYETGYPGFAGMGLPIDPVAAAEMDEPYIYHFPDGNASLARLMVRSLIPAVAPGSTMDDIVTAPFDYGRLDDAGSPTRLRLESTAVRVRNRDGGVDVGYVHGGELRVARAARCVLAGYHMMIPAIMPELPKPQRQALWQNTKAPLVYVKVAVRDWHPWVRLGVHEITNPMGTFSRVKLDYPVSLGDYRCSASPEEPMMLHLVHVPREPGHGHDMRTQARIGRGKLLGTSFAEFEKAIRQDLDRMLGKGGFDAGRDILAITVNRWSHGYSYTPNSLYDDVEEMQGRSAAARAKLGNIVFANSDTAWDAYAHSAMEEAVRAVGELLGAPPAEVRQPWYTRFLRRFSKS